MPTKTHEHGVEALAQAPADVDPTRTRTLRRKYAQRLRGRFADINTVIREAVKERDLFRLDADTEALEVPMLPVRDFRFTSDDEKVTAFREWLDDAQQQEVLSVISRNNNEFVRAAYGRGIKHANARLREEGVEVSDETLQEIFRQPVHREKLQLLYTRSFTALEGITDDVGKEISRVLTQGLAEGVGPDEMSRRLTDRVDKIGKTRATTLARTEVINAHADALNKIFPGGAVANLEAEVIRDMILQLPEEDQGEAMSEIEDALDIDEDDEQVREQFDALQAMSNDD